MTRSSSPSPDVSQPRRTAWQGYCVAILTTVLATLVGWPLYHGFQAPDEFHAPLIEHTNVLMLYLLGVLWVAARHSRGPAMLASVLGVAAFDFCFVPPYLRFAVHDPQYLVTFAVMLATALTISTLTHRVREHSVAARKAWEILEVEFLRNTLLSGVSHDLRTPLAAITGAASSLTDSVHELSPEARQEMLRTIREEADRMERLVNNLLETTRLESGGLALNREWQPLQEVIGSALHHLQKRLQDRPVKVTVSPTLPLILIDAVAMEQVLVNLLHNAIEYTPAASAIEISAAEVVDGWALSIADRGPGLPPGTEKRVFEKFFRAQPTNGQSRPGVGLGLALCRGIVEAHGGSIAATNRPGGGAEFRMTFPQTDAPPAVRSEE